MDKREILNIHVGQAGLQIGTACWELFCLEHGIWPDGQQGSIRKPDSQNAFTFFHETGAGKFVPRAMFVDLEPTAIDQIRIGFNRDLFSKNDFMVIGKEDAACNFARGRYSIGSEAIGVFKCRMRKLVENYENCQGFIMYNAFGGGTGSGFASLILDYLRDEYGKKTRIQFGVYPSRNISNIVVEPYNAVLATHSSMDQIDCCVMLDNEAMYTICRRKLNVLNPKYSNLNRIIAQAVSSLTASLRFGGLLNIGLDELQTNLVPFPRLHFPVLSYAPLMTWEKTAYDQFSVSDLTFECFEQKNQFIRYDPSSGKYMSCCLLFRGDVTMQEINRTILRLKASRQIKFVNWCPLGFKVGYNWNPPTYIAGGDLSQLPKACCMVANTTGVSGVWIHLVKKFNKMFAHRAFVHWYLKEGMEIDDFKEARQNMHYLHNDYVEAAGDALKDIGPKKCRCL